MIRYGTVGTSPFPPHGRVEYYRQGQRLCALAEGPFNVELAQKIATEGLQWCRHMRADGDFDHVCEFRRSVSAPREAFQQLQFMLQQMHAEGLSPVRTAYVFPPELEGGLLLSPLVKRIYASSGPTMRLFACREEALAWLQSPGARDPLSQRPPPGVE